MNKVDYLQCSNLQINHGYFKRHGGVSSSQFATLNATARVGDSDENALENRKRACDVLGVDSSKLVFLDFLPHGSENTDVTSDNSGQVLSGFDSITTTEKGLPIALAVADCNPIILTDNKSFVSIIHSGWRGTNANVIGKTVEHLKESLNIEPSDICAGIGPSISQDYYPVHQDVSKKFSDKYLRREGDQILLDLWAVAEDQLKDSGVGNIENLKVNTYKNPDFFSFREDKGDTGRFIVIAQI